MRRATEGTVCRPESISELVYCIFKDWHIQYIKQFRVVFSCAATLEGRDNACGSVPRCAGAN